MNYTDNLKLRKPEGGEYYDVEDFNKNSDLLDAAVNSKADKPRFATAGNFPMLDAGGNLGDSGKSASSFAAANHGHDAAYAPIAHVNDEAAHVSADEKATISAVASKADKSYVDSVLSTKLDLTGQKKLTDMDLNNAIIPGSYQVSVNAINNPMPAWGGVMNVISVSGAAYLKQHVKTFDHEFTRDTNDSGATWTVWQEIATTKSGTWVPRLCYGTAGTQIPTEEIEPSTYYVVGNTYLVTCRLRIGSIGALPAEYTYFLGVPKGPTSSGCGHGFVQGVAAVTVTCNKGLASFGLLNNGSALSANLLVPGREISISISHLI